MAVTVRIPAPLRKVTNDKDRVEVDAENLADMVQAMEEQYPGIKRRSDSSGTIGPGSSFQTLSRVSARNVPVQ